MGKHPFEAENGHQNAVSVPEAAEFLHVSAEFVAAQIESGRLPARMSGQDRLIGGEALQAFRAALSQKTETARQALVDAGQESGI